MCEAQGDDGAMIRDEVEERYILSKPQKVKFVGYSATCFFACLGFIYLGVIIGPWKNSFDTMILSMLAYFAALIFAIYCIVIALFFARPVPRRAKISKAITIVCMVVSALCCLFFGALVPELGVYLGAFLFVGTIFLITLKEVTNGGV